jgi:hypothetical protein
MQQLRLHSLQNSWAHNWADFSLELIIGGKTSDNIPFLKLFLQDYKKEFHVEVVNASCQKCIYHYHKDLINKNRKMENVSNYILHKKREGIQLEFGGALLITNENITDDYAKKLIARFKEIDPNFKLDDLFEVYPKATQEVQAQPVSSNKPKNRK